MTSVSLSRRWTVVWVSRVLISGTPAALRPSRLLTTGCSATVMPPSLSTSGVMSSVTPVWKLCTWVVAMVPALPAVVVRMESVSPARMVAVRPERVVMRGSASTRPWPLEIARLSCSPNESGVREKPCSRPSRGMAPLASGGGVDSV